MSAPVSVPTGDGAAAAPAAHEPGLRTGPGPLLAGTLAVCWLLATTRWGSHVGIASIYLTDVLVAGAGILLLVRAARRRVAPPLGQVTVLALLLAWVTLRLVASWPLSANAARDVAPYLYAVLGLLAAWSIALDGSGDAHAAPGSATRHRSLRWVVGALQVHAAWWALVTLVPGIPDALPALDDVPLLSLRPDIDSALAGVYAGWLLTGILRGERLWWRAAGFVVLWALIVQSPSRAGLLGALAVTGIVLVLHASKLRALTVRTLVGLAAAAVVALIVVVVATPVGPRLLGTLGWQQGDANAMQAHGTANARSQAWSRLVHYSAEDPVRTLTGVGFGPDFMADAGALELLLGTSLEQELVGGPQQTTRSPHNYWLGSLVRLGAVGLLLLVSTIVVAGVRQVRAARRPGGLDDLLLLGSLVSVAVLVTASLGVVLESPFGAVPFWWFIGIAAMTGIDSDRQLLARYWPVLAAVVASALAVLLLVAHQPDRRTPEPFPGPPEGPALAALQDDLAAGLASTRWAGTGEARHGTDVTAQTVDWCATHAIDLARCTFGRSDAPRLAVLVGESSDLLDVGSLADAMTADGTWRLLSTLGHEDVAALLGDQQPDLVVVTGLAGDADRVRLAGQQLAGLDAATTVVWLPPAPSVTRDPSCQPDSAPDACVGEPEAAWTPAERVQAGWLDQAVIDPTPWFCVDGRCPVVVGDARVRSTTGAVTPRYAERLGPVIAEALALISSRG